MSSSINSLTNSPASTLQIENILKDWKLWPNLCQEQPTIEQVSPLVDGLTNSNWLLKVDDGSQLHKYVIRINAKNNLALKLNRQAEWDMHQSISHYHICPAYSYRDPKDIYWIRPFLKTHTLEHTVRITPNFIDNYFLEKTASLFKIIHKIPITDSWPSINFPELIQHYWQKTKEKQISISTNSQVVINLANARQILDTALKTKSFTPSLCHMDPNPSNWILNGKELHLIDWEYAALGNPAWDLAVFCDTNFLNLSQVNTLLGYYKNITFAEYKLASSQMKYLSELWFYVQGHLTDSELLAQLRLLIETSD